MNPHLMIPNDGKPGNYEPLLPTHITLEPETPTPAPAEGQNPRLKSRKRKFRILASLLFTLLVWKLVSHFILFRLVHYFESKEVPKWPIPPDVLVDYCAEWQENDVVSRHDPHIGYLSSSTEIELPIPSEKVFLISRGATAGIVTVQQGAHDGEVAKVKVIMQHPTQSALKRVKACLIHQGEGSVGVGLFNLPWSKGLNHIGFQVTVDLPRANDSSPLVVKNFETDMPLFAHHVEDLESLIHFGHISLKMSNMPTIVKSLQAKDASVETSNTAIVGNFNVSSSLKLLTSNSRIAVNVRLYNGKDEEPADLVMQTSNGQIKSNIQLASPKETGGKFEVAALTSFGDIDVTFTSAPVDSALKLNAHTSLAPAKVQLYKTYQGTFDLQSSLHPPRVSYDSEETDPAGEGRQRSIKMKRVRSSIGGVVSWSEEGKALGNVNVETSWSSVLLKL